MKRMMAWIFAGVIVFGIAWEAPVLNAQSPRINFMKMMKRVVPLTQIQIAKADFVVRNVRIDVESDCAKDRILTVTVEVWNIGDADYDSNVKKANFYWDYSTNANEWLCFSEIYLPSIPKGQFVTLTHTLRRSRVWPGAGLLLKKTPYFVVSTCPNILEDYVLEKNYKNNLNRQKAANPCYNPKLIVPALPRK